MTTKRWNRTPELSEYVRATVKETGWWLLACLRNAAKERLIEVLSILGRLLFTACHQLRVNSDVTQQDGEEPV
jgi:hypothetical protein